MISVCGGADVTVPYDENMLKVQEAFRNMGGAVEVIVKDNGVGIPQNEVPYVFDRFYRAENSGINKTGSGLGLSIVKSIMDKHGGKIWAESEEGQGSEFHIVFRASEFNFDEEPEDEE